MDNVLGKVYSHALLSNSLTHHPKMLAYNLHREGKIDIITTNMLMKTNMKDWAKYVQSQQKLELVKSTLNHKQN